MEDPRCGSALRLGASQDYRVHAHDNLYRAIRDEPVLGLVARLSEPTKLSPREVSEPIMGCQKPWLSSLFDAEQETGSEETSNITTASRVTGQPKLVLDALIYVA